MDRNATLQFLEDQLHDLQLDFDDAQGQFHLQQHAQDALHAPPDEMPVGGENEPQDVQGVSELDFEEPAPQPVQVRVPLSSSERGVGQHVDSGRYWISFVRLLLV